MPEDEIEVGEPTFIVDFGDNWEFSGNCMTFTLPDRVGFFTYWPSEDEE